MMNGNCYYYYYDFPKRAFAGTFVTEIKIPGRITELEGTFICTKLVDVVVPGNVKKLDNPNLHSVYIDETNFGIVLATLKLLQQKTVMLQNMQTVTVF